MRWLYKRNIDVDYLNTIQRLKDIGIYDIIGHDLFLLINRHNCHQVTDEALIQFLINNEIKE